MSELSLCFLFRQSVFVLEPVVAQAALGPVRTKPTHSVVVALSLLFPAPSSNTA